MCELYAQGPVGGASNHAPAPLATYAHAHRARPRTPCAAASHDVYAARTALATRLFCVCPCVPTHEQDAYLPQRLLDKLMYAYNYVEMARVTGGCRRRAASVYVWCFLSPVLWGGGGMGLWAYACPWRTV